MISIMKQTLVILSLVLFAYIQLFNGMVWISYELNKAEIIQKFCENKDKPELKCEGTCHVKKMMLDEASESGEEPLSELPEIQLFFESNGFVMNEIQEIQSPNFYYSNLYSYGVLDEIDMPPKA